MYSFNDELLHTKRTYQINGSVVTIRERHVYDHAGRMLETWHAVNGASEVLLVRNEYNELGQLIKKSFTRPVSMHQLFPIPKLVSLGYPIAITLPSTATTAISIHT